MALKPVTVSQLNEYISRILSTDPLLGNISVKGEISNLKYHSSGHIYFSMIDETSKINCFLPASYVKNINYQLGDGLEIIVHGYLNVYKKGGTYTLFVRSIEVSGEGNLSMAFELIKNKLNQEGLFDLAHKKPIPKFPKKIGVVTSETGAAIKDILKIIKNRTNLVDIIIFPVLVQGESAAQNISETLDMINDSFRDIDVLILGRGGGSSEDLWAFNEEKLARAVYRCKIPIISAVGHEIDFCICDFVADMRAETPTAAAEAAVPDDKILKDNINNLKAQLSSCLKGKLEDSKLLSDTYIKEAENSLIRKIDGLRYSLERHLLTLQENNPQKILSGGYAIIEDLKGNVVSSVSRIIPENIYKISLKDGSAQITVSAVKIEGE